MKRLTLLLSLCVYATLLIFGALTSVAQTQSASTASGEMVGVPWTGERGITETVAQITERERALSWQRYPHETEREKILPDRRNLPQNPAALSLSQWPLSSTPREPQLNPTSPQTLGISWTGATLSGANPTSSFPPDVMGAVGPTQFIVFVNGRIVSFNKTAGAADGVLNADPDVFFNSVINGSSTSDPRIRYDRLSGRWFLVIINVSTPNRILIAVSTQSTITSSANFTFFFIDIATISPPISNTCFMDYPTLGIDVNALYIGGNNFCPTNFNSTDGYVVRKGSLLSGGPIVATVFRGLVATSTGAGPFTPQGVDNYDPAATEGYFIGVDNATFGTLMLRRVSTPGGTPTISSNISIATTLTTQSPLTVPHLGNTGGTNGNLDALDDRLFAAHLRNGRLWTAHNIGVNNTGTTTGTRTRNAARWYELQNLTATPSIVQSGTVFTASASNTTDQLHYWIPSIMVSGQGHAALGFSTAGTNNRVNAGTVGRLASDALGTMQTPVNYTASSTAYNPPSDPGPTRRWGDYSYTSVDPSDDQTLWTIQQFCDATNSYGVRIQQLMAPPPAIPSNANPAAVPAGNSNVDIIVTGTSSSGSGFFDPGAGFTNRIAAVVNGGGVTVNSVTYTDPTHITVNISVSAGASQTARTITVTNPDGQTATSASAILTISALPVQLASFNGRLMGAGIVRLDWLTVSELNNYGFEIQTSSSLNGEYETLPNSFIAGHGTTLEPQHYRYTDSAAHSQTPFYRLKQIDLDGSVHTTDGIAVQGLTSVNAASSLSDFSLAQNYPNPFNPATTIDYSLPTAANVRLEVFNQLGQEVAVLVNARQQKGKYSETFNASGLSSGVYLYRLTTEHFVQMKKLVVLK